MDKVAASPRATRADLFRETAARRGLPPTVVEKDFWICWTLKQVFSEDTLKDSVLFKGGTSLSKTFGLIERFSEDIDLAVDYAPLGFTGDRDPSHDMSRSRREKLLKEMMAACRKYISGPLLAALRNKISSVLVDLTEWHLDVSERDPNAVVFRYPAATGESLKYIRPAVLLELGTHAELIPSGLYPIQSYAAEEFPNLFAEPSCEIKTITAERTFWEKATILHAEYYRPEERAMPIRYSRHYYDLAMMAESPTKKAALEDQDLLKRVVKHKKRFYPAAWAKYDLAVQGTFRLVPQEKRLKALSRDYDEMGVMIFADAPEFDWIIARLTDLEEEINAL